MKKFLLIVGVMTLTLGLSACGFMTDDPDPDPDPDPVVLESVVISGHADQSIMIGDELNVFDGVIATGSDDVDYTDLITVASDDCYIEPNGDLDTSTKGDCIIDYTVVVEGKLDRVSITVTIEKEAVVVDPDDPVLKEWTFETDDDLLGWSIYELSPGSVVASIDNGALKLVTTSGSNVWDTRYSFMEIPFQQGVLYTITFDAKSSLADKVVNVQVGELIAFDPWFTNFKDGQDEHFTLTTEWATYTLSFLMELDNVNGGLLFEMGNINDSIGIDADIWYDNIKILGGGGDDIVGPAITGADDITVFTGDVFDPMTDVTAFDFVDQSVTTQIVVTGDTVDMNTAGVYTLTYTVSDTAGNETVVDRVVTVLVDDAGPVLTGVDSLVITLGIAFDVLTDVTAVDNRDGDITADIVLTGDTLDIDVAGEYSVIYTVTDETGNVTTATRVITVSAMLFDETNLVLNGTFDAKVWGTWMADWNSTSATVAYDGSTVVLDIADVGAENWNIQLFQEGLSIVDTKQYRITFDAMSTVDREINVKLIAADGTEYVETVALTSTMTTFTVDFTVAVVDQAAKLDFELGGAMNGITVSVPSVVTFDNVLFEEFDGTAVVADTNQVLNGDFAKTDLDEWAHYERDWDPIITGTLEVVGGVAVYTYDGIGDATWNAKIQQFDIDLQYGQTYKLTFDAKGDAARPFTGVFYDGATNWVTPLYDLTTEWQTFEYVFTYNGQALPRMEFLMGNRGPTEGGVFYLDNVNLGVLQQDELLLNGEFEVSGWSTWMADWNATDASVTFDTGAIVIDVVNTGDANWNIQLFQEGMDFVDTTQYRITFDAMSTVDRDINIKLIAADATEFAQTVSLTGTMQTFTFDFTFNIADQAGKLDFELGLINAALASIITIDNIMLEEFDGTDVIADTNQVVNGTLDQAVDWGVWMADWNSTAATTSVVDGAMVLDITDVGAENWNIQLFQEGIELVKGITYTIEFDAMSTVDRDINLKMITGTEYTEMISLTSTMTTYTFTFTYTENDGLGKLDFELGGAMNGILVSVPSVVTIDNVIIYANYNPIVED